MKYLVKISAIHPKPIREIEKDNTFAVSCGLRQECSLDLFLFFILFDFLPSRTNVEKNVVYADGLALISDNQAID